MHRLLPITLLASACITNAAQADDRGPHGVREPPRVERYNPITDKFRHIESTLAPLHSERRGGELAYYGNRLQRYKYLGRPNTGGIYDALEDYRLQVGPDPKNYQYRW